MPANAKKYASGNIFFGSPFFMTYIGPPRISPSLLFSRNITDRVHVKNFVAIPIIAVTHIQKIDPGPAIEIARATPAMLPNPIVPDNDAVRA